MNVTVIIALLACALAIGLAYYIGYRVYFRHELPRRLSVLKDACQAGDSLEACLTLRPARRLEIASISAILRITEQPTNPQDEDAFPRTLSEQTLLLSDAIELEPFSEHAYAIALTLPVDFQPQQQVAWLITDVDVKTRHEYDSTRLGLSD